MKILSLTAENFKRLVAVEINPDSNTVIISGKNKQGKSSVLDAIWAALQYPGQKKITDPIHAGKRKAIITVKLGSDDVELLVTREFKANGTQLKIIDKDGYAKGRPQELLDSLLNKLTFDPMGFIHQSDLEQVKIIVSAFGLQDELEELKNRRSQIFEQRTNINRQARDVEGELREFGPAEKIEPVSTNELMDESEKLRRRNYELSEINRKLNDATEQKRELEKRLKAANDYITEMEKQFDFEEYAETSEKLEQITEKIKQADSINEKASRYKRRQMMINREQELKSKSAQMSEDLEIVNENIRKLMDRIKLPIPGLKFDEDQLLLNGHPLRNSASDSERLMIAVAIAMVTNPELKVIRIRDGSLLDAETMQQLTKLADKEDYQIWIERVEEEPGGIIIQEGVIKNGK